MNEPNLVSELRKKGADLEKITGSAIDNPDLISELVDILKTEKGAIKYGCEKVIRLVSERKPVLIYPYFDFIEEMLDSDNSFLKWGAILTIANLACVDSENRFEKIFEKYYTPIQGPALVTAANIIGGSVKIVLAKPGLSEKIVMEILKVEKGQYINKGELSPECKNIACGAAIDAFNQMYEDIHVRKPVFVFVKKQLKNSRAKVKSKAEKFLKRYPEI